MDWKEITDIEKDKPYFQTLYNYVNVEYNTHTCYPPFELIFNALDATPLDKVKCVILGQDPYHEPKQAMGLSFSVNKGVQPPPSLQNIYKEIKEELGCSIPKHGNLTEWTKQGVLLLNAILTVREHEPASHAKKGWETYTDTLLSEINKQDRPIVYMLWGKFARSKKDLLTNPKHLILEAPHPSPFSAHYGFFGCGHFEKCNEFLKKNGIEPIDWQITN